MDTGLVNEMLAAAIRPLHDAVERHPERPLTPDPAQSLLAGARLLAGLVGGADETIQRMLQEGCEGQRGRTALRAHAEVLQESLSVFAEVRRRVAAADLPTALRAESLATLDELTRPVEKFRDEATRLLGWLNQPRPVIDPATLGGADDSPAAEGYISLDALIAELDQDGTA